MLKKQNGKYVIGWIANISAWYAAHEFQGTSTEVTVPLSSIVLLRLVGSKLCSSYTSLNILPGITIAKYWSQVLILKKIQDPAVDWIIVALDDVLDINDSSKEFRFV